MRVGEIKSDINFRAKNVTLYSDFDGTFLQTYSDGDYYRAFDDFRSERNGKFNMFITTGRSLDSKSKGFLFEYDRLRAQHTYFPKIDGVVTAEGGDVFLMTSKGDIDTKPVMDKRLAVEEQTRWNIDRVQKGMQEIAERLQATFKIDNKKGFHRTRLFVPEDQDINVVRDEINKFLTDNNINAETKIKTKDGNSYIKIAPHINGRRLHKDFDVKQALKAAIKENDFVIVAGNAMNDREMLNLFNYIGEPRIDEVRKISTQGLPDMIEAIRKLPIGVVFVNGSATDNKSQQELLAFMEEQRKLFPEKVMIVEESKKGENSLVNACRTLVESHFGKEQKPAASSSTKEIQYKGKNWKATFAVLATLLLANIGIYTLQYAKIAHNKKD